MNGKNIDSVGHDMTYRELYELMYETYRIAPYPQNSYEKKVRHAINVPDEIALAARKSHGWSFDNFTGWVDWRREYHFILIRRGQDGVEGDIGITW